MVPALENQMAQMLLWAFVTLFSGDDDTKTMEDTTDQKIQDDTLQLPNTLIQIVLVGFFYT